MVRSRIDRILKFPVEVCGRRTWVLITSSLAGFPLLTLASFYLLVCLARLDLGRWPVFNDPFPRTGLPAQVPFIGIGLSLLAAPYVGGVTLLAIMLGRYCHRDFPIWRTLLFAVVSGALLALMCEWDPGSFFNWFWD
jgi:hypothetical protein